MLITICDNILTTENNPGHTIRHQVSRQPSLKLENIFSLYNVVQYWILVHVS